MYDREQEVEISVNKAKDYEGFSPTIYDCPAGYPTLGYGRNLDVYPLDDGESETVTEEEATVWLREKISDCRLSMMIFCPWAVDVPSAVRVILTDMIYNLGAEGLMGFRKMLAAMKTGDYEQAAYELKDSKYYGQTGRRARDHFRTLKFLSNNEGE